MKVIASLILSAAAFSLQAQDLNIFEENGKYGYSTQPTWETRTSFVLAPEYDTIFCSAYEYDGPFIKAVKNGQSELYHFKDSQNEFRKLDTLGITHVFFHFSDSYEFVAIGSTPEGKAYMYKKGQFEPYHSNIPLIVCDSKNQYHLYANKKSITKESFDFIYPYNDSVFIGKNSNGYTFLNKDGSLLYPESINRYNAPWDGAELIIVYKGNKTGYIDLAHSTILTPQPIVSPAGFFSVSDDDYYSSGWENQIGYFAVSSDKGNLKGLIDVTGKEIWPTKYDDVVVLNFQGYQFFLRKTKANWELYAEPDQMETTLEFDEFIGSNSQIVYVKKGDELLAFNWDTYELVKPSKTGLSRERNVIVAQSGKIGAVNEDGEQIIPCEYDDAVDRFMDVVLMKEGKQYRVFDNTGKELLDWKVDQVWSFDETPGAYVYNVGEQWGVFTVDGSIKSPKLDIDNGWNQFSIDVNAHTYLKDAYVFSKEGKKGFINVKGEIICEAKYDDIFRSYWEVEDMNVGLIGNKWFIFAQDHVNVKDMGKAQFIDFTSDFGCLFLEGDRVFGIDPQTFEEVKYHFDNYPVTDMHLFDDSYGEEIIRKEGVVDQKGKVIIPFEYRTIILSIYGKDSKYIIAIDKNGKHSLFDLEGKLIIKETYDELNRICVKPSDVLFLKNEVGGYIAIWDSEKGVLQQITKKDVARVECVNHRNVDHMAEIEYRDGTFALLFPSLEIVEKK